MGLGHAHPHGHPPHAAHGTSVGRKLLISTVATLLFVGLELGVGVYANSLSLIGDAFHNLTDAVALLFALIVIRIERKPPTHAKSYGYHRAGVLAAFINAGTLIGFTIFLFIESFRRFRRPEDVDSFLMIVTATVALVLNTAITLWLRKDGKNDINVRSAVLHMFSDALSAAGIIIGGFVIRYTGWQSVDPLISIIIGILILFSCWSILRETINLLLEGTPRGIDPADVSRDLAAEPGVYGVHHLHIWALAPTRPALSCHLMLGDVPLKSTGEILHRVTTMLAKRHHIVHTTIQFEYAACPAEDPYCVPSEVTAEKVETSA